MAAFAWDGEEMSDRPLARGGSDGSKSTAEGSLSLAAEHSLAEADARFKRRQEKREANKLKQDARAAAKLKALAAEAMAGEASAATEEAAQINSPSGSGVEG